MGLKITMTRVKCPKCGSNTYFDMDENTYGPYFDIIFVRCTKEGCDFFKKVPMKKSEGGKCVGSNGG